MLGHAMPSSDPSSVVFASPLMFEFLVRNAVAENHVGCQDHANPRDAAFPNVDVLVVIPVIPCKRGGAH